MLRASFFPSLRSQHLLWKDEDLREVLPDGGARQHLLAEVQPRPSTSLRKCCQMFPAGLMLPVAISCLPRDIVPIWSKHSEPGGRAERYRQGTFTCWLILSPWLRPSSNS